MKQRLPTISRGREFAEAGCLTSYGENLEQVYRHAATYVAQILKGANPAELAVEEVSRFELVINFKTAWALGLAIPQSVLLRADRIME